MISKLGSSMLSALMLSLLSVSPVEGRKTIMVSIDGFGWDRYGTVPTPNLDSIRDRGVQAKNMKNAFPTLTFPNHYTLATGMWVEGHGVVDNRMYDPEMNEMFDFRTCNVDLCWWNGAEPIWITAEKNGLRTASVNWPGDFVDWNGIKPSVVNAYSKDMAYTERIDRALGAMFGELNAELALIYFEEPDDSSHKFGSSSPEYLSAIQKVDEHIGYLLARIDIEKDVNLVIVSDHGTADVSKERIVVVDKHTQVPHFVSSWGPVAHVWPKDLAQAELLHQELASSIPKDQAECVLKADLPESFRFKANKRIAPIICIGAIGWVVLPDDAKKKAFAYKGHHGYSSEDENSPLRPIFLAAGPDIRNIPEQIPPFDMVHVYPLLAQLVGLPQEVLPQIDGKLEAIEHIIKCEEQDHTMGPITI